MDILVVEPLGAFEDDDWGGELDVVIRCCWVVVVPSLAPVFPLPVVPLLSEGAEFAVVNCTKSNQKI